MCTLLIIVLLSFFAFTIPNLTALNKELAIDYSIEKIIKDSFHAAENIAERQYLKDIWKKRATLGRINDLKDFDNLIEKYIENILLHLKPIKEQFFEKEAFAFWEQIEPLLLNTISKCEPCRKDIKLNEKMKRYALSQIRYQRSLH